MITRCKTIYEQVARENRLDTSLVESIGSFVFAELRHALNSPNELAYELPKLGTFILRQKKFLKFQDILDRYIEQGSVVIKTEAGQKRYAEQKLLVKKIEQFKKDKLQKRTLRFAKDEEKPDTPSESQPEAHQVVPSGIHQEVL